MRCYISRTIKIFAFPLTATVTQQRRRLVGCCYWIASRRFIHHHKHTHIREPRKFCFHPIISIMWDLWLPGRGTPLEHIPACIWLRWSNYTSSDYRVWCNFLLRFSSEMFVLLPLWWYPYHQHRSISPRIVVCSGNHLRYDIPSPVMFGKKFKKKPKFATE